MSLKLKLSASALTLALAATAAHAADVAPPPAPAPSGSTTIGMEFSPEWRTSNGTWADDYVKASLSHSFANNIVAGTSFQYTWRDDTTSVDQIEASLGYKIKSGAFTITPGVLLGYGFGDHPKINRLVSTEADAYYALTLAADVKIDDHWTWNAFNARYRNAFNTTWITPKVSTGITYKFDNANAIYANVGYAWKDNGNGQGLLGDKWNVAVGYKYTF